MGHIAETQEPVFALLADPATHGGQGVRRIDTHVAAVFLAGDRALKVKRAVRFPFLDFSDFAKRRAACEAEARRRMGDRAKRELVYLEWKMERRRRRRPEAVRRRLPAYCRSYARGGRE